MALSAALPNGVGNSVRNTLRLVPLIVLHELRVPLTVYRGHPELLLLRDPERQTDSVPVVQAMPALADNAVRHTHRGCLGLAVAGAIARAHGGHIELMSRPRSGATFAFKLPLST